MEDFNFACEIPWHVVCDSLGLGGVDGVTVGIFVSLLWHSCALFFGCFLILLEFLLYLYFYLYFACIWVMG